MHQLNKPFTLYIGNSSYISTRFSSSSQYSRVIWTGDLPSFQCIEEPYSIGWPTDLNDVFPRQLQQVCPWSTKQHRSNHEPLWSVNKSHNKNYRARRASRWQMQLIHMPCVVSTWLHGFKSWLVSCRISLYALSCFSILWQRTLRRADCPLWGK